MEGKTTHKNYCKDERLMFKIKSLKQFSKRQFTKNTNILMRTYSWHRFLRPAVKPVRPRTV